MSVETAPTQQHKNFLSRLRGSSDAVFAVARWLHSHGKTIEIPAVRYAPTASDADDFVDGGDLWMIDAKGRRRIEIKKISHLFWGRDDWPFNEVFVSNSAAVQRAQDVAAYFTVSADLLYAAIIKAESKEHWYVTEKLAKNTGNVERFYACPLEHVVFVSLEIA